MCVVSRAGCKEGPFPADSMLLVVRYSFLEPRLHIQHLAYAGLVELLAP